MPFTLYTVSVTPVALTVDVVLFLLPEIASVVLLPCTVVVTLVGPTTVPDVYVLLPANVVSILLVIPAYDVVVVAVISFCIVDVPIFTQLEFLSVTFIPSLAIRFPVLLIPPTLIPSALLMLNPLAPKLAKVFPFVASFNVNVLPDNVALLPDNVTFPKVLSTFT